MIFIRADANEKIGTGHVMRCLSIASAFAEKGEKVVFVTADHRGDKLIERSGFDIVCLESDWTNIESETDSLLQLISEMKPALLLVDSYYVTQYYFKQLSSKIRTAYFDDMNKAEWDVDCLINYNVFAKTFDYSWYVKRGAKLLLGPGYAPLRKEFGNLSAHIIKDNITDVLISAGGSDPEKVTERFMKQICPQLPAIRFHFVVGALNPRIREIKQLESGNIILHINECHMAELMRKCDIAISAAGTTLYEMCAAGIPTITYILADNQIVAAENFDIQKIMINVGDCRIDNGFIEKIEECLFDLSKNKMLRNQLSKNMQSLVDGNGAERIVKKIL